MYSSSKMASSLALTPRIPVTGSTTEKGPSISRAMACAVSATDSAPFVTCCAHAKYSRMRSRVLQQRQLTPRTLPASSVTLCQPGRTLRTPIYQSGGGWLCRSRRLAILSASLTSFACSHDAARAWYWRRGQPIPTSTSTRPRRTSREACAACSICSRFRSGLGNDLSSEHSTTMDLCHKQKASNLGAIARELRALPIRSAVDGRTQRGRQTAPAARRPSCPYLPLPERVRHSHACWRQTLAWWDRAPSKWHDHHHGAPVSCKTAAWRITGSWTPASEARMCMTATGWLMYGRSPSLRICLRCFSAAKWTAATTATRSAATTAMMAVGRPRSSEILRRQPNFATRLKSVMSSSSLRTFCGRVLAWTPQRGGL